MKLSTKIVNILWPKWSFSDNAYNVKKYFPFLLKLNFNCLIILIDYKQFTKIVTYNFMFHSLLQGVAEMVM